MITRTILLINSEPNVREVIQDCLSHLGGWQVLSTGSPSEALRRAAQDQPDAIVFDLSTFGMNFFNFLNQLRSQPLTQNIPVVLIAVEAKWLNIEPLQALQIAGIIDYSGDPARLPQQIAQLLNWDQAPQGVGVED
jgi:CheY-like chemotaxis protein